MKHLKNYMMHFDKQDKILLNKSNIIKENEVNSSSRNNKGVLYQILVKK